MNTTTATIKEILCVEEQEEICLLLTRMLDRKDFKVSHERHIDRAIDFLRAKQPALMVIDNHFFESTGIAYIAQIKAMRPDTKLLLLSVQVGKIKERSLSAGVDIFLTKPFTKSQLVESILSLIEDADKRSDQVV